MSNQTEVPLLWQDGADVGIWLRLNEFPARFVQASIYRSWQSLDDDEDRSCFTIVSQDGSLGWSGCWTLFVQVVDGESSMEEQVKTWAGEACGLNGPRKLNPMMEYIELWEESPGKQKFVINLWEHQTCESVPKSLGLE